MEKGRRALKGVKKRSEWLKKPPLAPDYTDYDGPRSY